MKATILRTQYNTIHIHIIIMQSLGPNRNNVIYTKYDVPDETGEFMH